MTKPEASRAEDLALLVSAAREAGGLVMTYWKKPVRQHKKADGTIVTEADLAADALLAERLRSQRPGYGWLSEESSDPDSRLNASRVWLVDPIDGTSAFVRRAEDWTIALALLEEKQPVLAVIYNAARNELFSAAKDEGARLNDKPIAVSGKSDLEGARFAVSQGLMSKPAWREAWPAYEILNIASLAYRFAYIACGRADAAFAVSPKSEWDIAAGALLVQEAGGIVTAHNGAPLVFNNPVPRVPGFIASTKNLHAALAKRLALGIKENPNRQ